MPAVSAKRYAGPRPVYGGIAYVTSGLFASCRITGWWYSLSLWPTGGESIEASSVRRRLFRPVDDQDLDGHAARFEAETELFLQDGKDRWPGLGGTGAG